MTLPIRNGSLLAHRYLYSMSSRAGKTTRINRRNITQISQCNQSPTVRFLAALGMTVFLFSRRQLRLTRSKMANGAYSPRKNEQGHSVHLQEVKRARIGKKTQNRKCFRFVQQKSVIKTCQFVSNERDHKIKLRPETHAHDRHGIWPVSAGQHQEDDADDDARNVR